MASPQILSRGKRRLSMRSTSSPARAANSAVVAPAGPAPMTTSWRLDAMRRGQLGAGNDEQESRAAHEPRAEARRIHPAAGGAAHGDVHREHDEFDDDGAHAQDGNLARSGLVGIDELRE